MGTNIFKRNKKEIKQNEQPVDVVSQFDKDPIFALDVSKSMLLRNCPFFLEILLLMKVKMGKSLSTAGIRVIPSGVVELYINPEFFINLPRNERVGLILHEIGHLIGEHFTRGTGLNKNRANIAMDCALNQTIPLQFLPSLAITPESLSKKLNIDVKKNESFEYYYELLSKVSEEEVEKLNKKSKRKQNSGQGPGQGQSSSEESDNNEELSDSEPQVMDDHDYWDEGENNQDNLKNIVGQLLNEAKQNTEKNHGNGHIPKEFLDKVEELLKVNVIPWEKLLKLEIGSKVTFNIVNTRKRPNRRLGLKAPGHKKGNGPYVLFASDSSGSVSDELHNRIQSEIYYCSKLFLDRVKEFFFDSDLFRNPDGSVKLYELGKCKKLPRRPASGGTNFQPIIDFANTMRPDLLIIVTDGEAPIPKNIKCKVLWVIFGPDNPKLPGKRIIIPNDYNKQVKLTQVKINKQS